MQLWIKSNWTIIILVAKQKMKNKRLDQLYLVHYSIKHRKNMRTNLSWSNMLVEPTAPKTCHMKVLIEMHQKMCLSQNQTKSTWSTLTLGVIKISIACFCIFVDLYENS